jgi:hypothetical protein
VNSEALGCSSALRAVQGDASRAVLTIKRGGDMTDLGMEQPSPTERQPRACDKCHKTMRHLADLRSVGAFPAVQT